ncbi:MAG: hypothetical protein K2J72_05315 [Oscillospiraceae bacterium]|nr:hypothetical protein [Oscillospiraceae bacterium]
MNVKEKAKNAVMTVRRKALPVIASDSVAMSTAAVNVFAAEGEAGSTDIYQTIADSFKSGATAMSVGIGLIFAAVIPILIGIVGVYAAIGAGKKILTKLTS